MEREVVFLFNKLSSLPFIRIFPFVGVSSPPIKLSKVDFPEPEVPTIAINSPSFTCILTSGIKEKNIQVNYLVGSSKEQRLQEP